jgi:hypothetical protein
MKFSGSFPITLNSWIEILLDNSYQHGAQDSLPHSADQSEAHLSIAGRSYNAYECQHFLRRQRVSDNMLLLSRLSKFRVHPAEAYQGNIDERCFLDE